MLSPLTNYNHMSKTVSVCAGAPSLDNDKSVPLVMARPALGENFPNITGTTLLGTCNNCSSPNTTQYIYAPDSNGQFTCQNGTYPAQVDWTGFCMCDQFGGCYQFRPLPDGSATINSVVTLTVFGQPYCDSRFMRVFQGLYDNSRTDN